MTTDSDEPAVGSYALLLELTRPATLEVGALGAHDLPAGGYAYVGSAFGPGGLARVDRHREVAAGERSVRHWHVDYLLGHPDSVLVDARRLPGVDAECALATALVGAEQSSGGDGDGDPPRAAASVGSVPDVPDFPGVPGVPVPGFGASDCDCPTHLAYRPSIDGLAAAVDEAVARVIDPEEAG